MQKNDILWKSILEDVVEDFLTFFYPESAQIFDFERGFTFLDNELQQLFPPEEENYERKYVDKLVQVFTKEGKDHWVLIHIEVQGSAQVNFEERMFRYYYRIYDKFKKEISAFAILTDTNSKFQPNEYRQRFLGTELTYKFNSYKLMNQSKEELKANPNPFACVILAALAATESKSKGDEFTLQFKKELYYEFKDRNIPPKKKLAIALFLQNYVNFNNQEYVIKYNNEIKHIKNKTMGIEEFIKQQLREEAKIEGRKEGREEGRVEEREEMAKKFKDAGVDINVISNVTGLSVEVIKQL